MFETFACSARGRERETEKSGMYGSAFGMTTVVGVATGTPTVTITFPAAKCVCVCVCV